MPTSTHGEYPSGQTTGWVAEIVERTNHTVHGTPEEATPMDSNSRRRHIDLAHHHPRVRKVRNGWAWDCACGGASIRTLHPPLDWRDAFGEALRHSATIAA